MRENTVCFTGSFIAQNQKLFIIKEKLETTLLNLINKGYTDFVCGGEIGFDMLAAMTVLRFKKEHPQIKLRLVLPHHNFMGGWLAKDAQNYAHIIDNADSIEYISDKRTWKCMRKRDLRLVEMSSVCVNYINNEISNDVYSSMYSSSKKKQIKNDVANTVFYALLNGLLMIDIEA